MMILLDKSNNFYINTNYQFEIPYNFDLKLIDSLKIILNNYKDICLCIYLPPFQEHYKSIYRTNFLDKKFQDLSWDDYLSHIYYINHIFPNKIQLLLQQPDILIPKNLLNLYLSLGINQFCVGSIEQAKILKNINKNIKITCSVGMYLKKDKIENLLNFKQYIDYIVLPFYYTKHLNELKILPKEFNYILFCNSGCNYLCSGLKHWYQDKYNINKIDICPGTIDIIGWEKSARIRPMDLKLFSPYVSAFKLVDRGFSTDAIIRDLILYTTNFELYPEIIINENIYNQ